MSHFENTHTHTHTHTWTNKNFAAGSAQRAWLEAYKKGVHAFVDRAVAAKVRPFFFVDLLVFPKEVLAVWSNATDPKTGHIYIYIYI